MGSTLYLLGGVGQDTMEFLEVDSEEAAEATSSGSDSSEVVPELFASRSSGLGAGIEAEAGDKASSPRVAASLKTWMAGPDLPRVMARSVGMEKKKLERVILIDVKKSLLSIATTLYYLLHYTLQAGVVFVFCIFGSCHGVERLGLLRRISSNLVSRDREVTG